MKKIIYPCILSIFLCLGCNNDDDTILSNCDEIAVVNDEIFNNATNENFGITAVTLDQDCLSVTIAASGCNPDNWDLNLVASESIFESLPTQREAKIEFVNPEVCLAAFEKTVTFDLTPIQTNGQNEVHLHLEDWDEVIIYTY